MGTRGIMGFRVDGKDYLSYNHFDSYPGGLGLDVLSDLKSMLGDWGLENLKQKAKEVRLIDEHDIPTVDDVAKLNKFANTDVSSGSIDEWYVLLRNLQGKLQDTISAGYMIDSYNFVKESLFCEWGYIVNLDDEVLEIYEGFQEAPHNKGRFALPEGETPKPRHKNDNCKYQPIALVATIPFAELPDSEGFGIKADPEGALYQYLNENNMIDINMAKSVFNIDLIVWVEKQTEEGEEFEWLSDTTVQYTE